MSDTTQKKFERTLGLLLRPIARLLIANDLPLPRFLELMKRALIDEAITNPSATDSYVSLKTGVHRKDVKRLRDMSGSERALTPVATPLATILTCWTQDAAFCDAQGQPRPLTRKRRGDLAGFDDLVLTAKIDLPPATVIKELLQQSMMTTAEDGQFVLISDTYIPTLGDAVLDAFQATVIEHVNVAVSNALSTSAKGKEFDRVLRYSHLSQASVDELEAASRKAALDYLHSLNKLAHDLQTRDDAGDAPTAHRFISGVYITSKPLNPNKTQIK